MLILFIFLWVEQVFYPQDPGKRSDAYRQQAERLFDQEKYEESLSFYKKAFGEVEQADKIRAANLCNDISSAYYGLQQFDRSIEACRKGIAILNKTASKPDSVYFKLYSSLGTMFHSKTQSDSSTYYFLLSDQLLNDNKKLANEIPEYVLHHYLNQGRAVWRKYRYYDSIEYFQKALDLSKRENMHSELFYIYSGLAEVYDLLGQHGDALSWRLQAVEQVPKERVQSRLSLYTGVGNTYRLLNKNDSALVWLKKSLVTLSQIPNQTENYKIQHLYILTELANIHLQKGEAGKARELLSQIVGLHRKSNLKRAVLHSRILLALGEYERYTGNHEKAINYFDAAYRQLLSDSLGKTHAGSNPVKYPKYALIALQAKTEIFDTRYKQTGNLADLERSFKLYEQLIAIKKDSYQEVASSIDDRFLYTSNTQPTMERAVLNGFRYYKKNQSPETLNTLFKRFEDANATFLMDVLSGNSDEENENLLRKSVEINQIKEQLDQQSVFISYKLVENQLMAFVITKQKAEVSSWPIDVKKFESDLASLLLEIKSNPGLGIYKGSAAAQYCYNALLRPLQKEIDPYKRWIVVRDWKFSSLPFEILEEQPEKYLSDNRRISYAYSASIFWFHPLLKSVKPNNRDAFVFAPFVKPNGYENNIMGWRPVSTEEEVKKMGQANLMGPAATKQNFYKHSSEHYILNLATHAFADLKNPNSSYIQFYPGVDGKLYLEEILDLKLEKTRLILLSSCFGNDGASVAGEGTISLAYAFAQAGCPTLITSNWEANENTISFLTLQISKYIDEGKPLDEAVQLSRLDLRNNGNFGKYDHPYFWANISLIGNHSPVYLSKDTVLSKYLLLVIPLLAGLVWLLIRRKPQANS